MHDPVLIRIAHYNAQTLEYIHSVYRLDVLDILPIIIREKIDHEKLVQSTT